MANRLMPQLDKGQTQSKFQEENPVLKELLRFIIEGLGTGDVGGRYVMERESGTIPASKRASVAGRSMDWLYPSAYSQAFPGQNQGSEVANEMDPVVIDNLKATLSMILPQEQVDSLFAPFYAGREERRTMIGPGGMRGLPGGLTKEGAIKGLEMFGEKSADADKSMGILDALGTLLQSPQSVPEYEGKGLNGLLQNYESMR